LINRLGELSSGNRMTGHDALPAAFGDVIAAGKIRQITKRCRGFLGRDFWAGILGCRIFPGSATTG
jgi:hypothetical protein